MRYAKATANVLSDPRLKDLIFYGTDVIYLYIPVHVHRIINGFCVAVCKYICDSERDIWILVHERIYIDLTD